MQENGPVTAVAAAPAAGAPTPAPVSAINITRLLEAMGRLQASDLHVKVGVPPTYRINGILRDRPIFPKQSGEQWHTGFGPRVSD